VIARVESHDWLKFLRSLIPESERVLGNSFGAGGGIPASDQEDRVPGQGRADLPDGAA